MATRWSFFAFDWSRFRSVESALRAASESGDFTAVEIEGADETLANVDENTPPEEVCNALVADLCGVSDSAVFERGLPELIAWMRKQPNGEEPGETLAVLISATPNVEEWFAAEQGIVGILDVWATASLAEQITLLQQTYRKPPAPRGLAALTRHFATSEPAIEHLDDLFALIAEAAENHHGLAAFRE